MPSAVSTLPDGSSPFTTLNNPGNAGEFVAMDYRGYGYQLWMMTGPAFGELQVYLDGVLQPRTNPDGSTTQIIDCYAAGPALPAVVLTNESVPIDLHRLRVLALGTKNSASSSNAVNYMRLQVMR